MHIYREKLYDGIYNGDNKWLYVDVDNNIDGVKKSE
jgi:hypothetical protein